MATRRLIAWTTLGIAAGMIAAACGSDDGGTTGDSCTPSAEVCDGLDNDCDGTADESLTEACEENGESGTRTCVNGSWGACETSCTPSTEVCDGQDNDCDSAVDEDDAGQALRQPCTDNGQDGTQICTAGAWGACDTDCTPTAETCDGLDNDCDAAIDEDTAGSPMTQPCTENGFDGTQTCSGGTWGACEIDCAPTNETCDGEDNDCDGETDEDDSGEALTQDCSNDCGLGTEVCANGSWQSCTAPEASAEVCDGLDNDCDNEIDEDFECAKGATDNCGTDVGECEFGTKVCGATCVWGNCIGGVSAGTEACEGVNDEDCDGTVDNGCGCTNGATKDCCGGTQITCAGGTWPACPAAPTETCNAIDDDCDGETDEGLPVNPYQLDEDISGVNDCDHAEPLTAILATAPQSFSYHLYKPDLSEDRDFFLFRADEDSDGACFLSDDYECYSVIVKLTPPSGADYDFCVYDVGFAGSTTTCASPEQKICASDEAPFDEVTINWQGDCGWDDDRYFYLEVFPTSGSTLSCAPYSFTIEVPNNEPQEEACTW